MRRNSLAWAVILGSVASTAAFAQATSPEENALLFLDSQVFPQKAAACTARLPSYPARFEPAFRAWIAANKDRLASGEAFLRADAERTQVPFERDIQTVIAGISRQWTSAPLPVLQENCEAMLVQLNP